MRLQYCVFCVHSERAKPAQAMVERYWLITALVVTLVGCGGAPEPRLEPIGDVIPPGISLAGRWQLRAVDDDAARRIRDAGQRAAGRVEDAISPTRREKSRSKGSKDSPSVHVFLETGRNLKITQTGDGLFISFDRSVVEEYQFREHRAVRVGPIEAERASGWQNGRYVILTADTQGAVLTETYALLDEDVLERTITIDHKQEQTLNVRQLFDRVR